MGTASRRIIETTCFLFSIIIIQAQQPFINDFIPKSGTVNQSIYINGSGFENTSAVIFGSVNATFTVLSDNQIETTVPAGASYETISVISDGKVGFSPIPFTLSFAGEEIENIGTENRVASNVININDICICDLDGDGNNDIATTHNTSDTNNDTDDLTVYLNSTSSPGSLSRAQSIDNTANRVGGFFGITCGDLDKDGKPELVITSNRGTNVASIFIYQNQSTVGSLNLSYQSSLQLLLPDVDDNNRIPQDIAISDIDGDGRSDLIVGNVTDHFYHVFRNTTTGTGVFSFSAPTEIDAGEATNTGSLVVADFNGDHKPDVATLPFRELNERIYILKNNSVAENTAFASQSSISDLEQRINIITADIDNDGNIDLITSNQTERKVSIFRNTSSEEEIIFETGIDVSLGVAVWGVSAGDINGDGLVDLVVSSNGNQNSYFILPNQSSSGTISFGTPIEISTSSSTLNTVVGDLNNDAKPDIAFTHNITSNSLGNMAYFLNENCISPEISPANLEFCFDSPFMLNATSSLSSTYSWSFNIGTGTINPSDESAEISVDPASGASVTIEVQIDQGACSTVASESYTVLGGSPPPIPTITASASVVCSGDDLTISAENGASGPYDSYLWTFPDGAIKTTSSIVFEGTTTQNAGSYLLQTKYDGECYSENAEFILEVSEIPASVVVVNDDNDNYCNDDDVTNDPQLRVADVEGISYQWNRDGSPISGANSTEISVVGSGAYSVSLENEQGCTSETEAYEIVEVDPPVSNFEGADIICIDSEIPFTSTATGDSRFDLVYSWQIQEDGSDVGNGTGETYSFLFDREGEYAAIHMVSYESSQVENCSNTSIQNITVEVNPSIEFSIQDGFEKCAEDTVNVTVNAPASSLITSYSWDYNDQIIDGDNLDLLTDENENESSAILTINTNIGCEISDTLTVVNFSESSLVAQIDDPGLTERDTTIAGIQYPLIVLEEEQNSINLSATGGSDYEWAPVENIDNPMGNSISFFPSQPLTEVMLSGIDDNTCESTYSLFVLLDNLRPQRAFSPNGDGNNDAWEVLNIATYDACEVFIFDSRGRNMLVANSPFDSNEVWDGTYNGSAVPEGIYFYAVRCTDANISKSGSLLLVR